MTFTKKVFRHKIWEWEHTFATLIKGSRINIYKVASHRQHNCQNIVINTTKTQENFFQNYQAAKILALAREKMFKLEVSYWIQFSRPKYKIFLFHPIDF